MTGQPAPSIDALDDIGCGARTSTALRVNSYGTEFERASNST
jgi:hypothetical protein